MSMWLKPDGLFDGEKLHWDLALRIEGGQATEIGHHPHARPVPGTLTPGFIDLQVNGGGGVLFNDEPEKAAAIAAAHHSFGTAAILPTVITDRPGVAERAARTLSHSPSILGIHFEGPHICVDRRGTHAAEHIRPMDGATIALIESLRTRDVAVMVTLAPEAATPEQITQISAMGAIVSLGHSDAPAEKVDAAISAGASCFTHLFNAMSQMEGRQPNMVGSAINSRCHVGLIADGFHVAPEMISLALRARPAPDLTFLVSDAMPTVGGPDTFSLYGQEIRAEGGRLINPEGNLAGSHSTISDGVATLMELGIDLQTILRMAITVPNQVIGADLARLIGRPTTDLFLLRGGRPVPLDQIIQNQPLP